MFETTAFEQNAAWFSLSVIVWIRSVRGQRFFHDLTIMEKL